MKSARAVHAPVAGRPGRALEAAPRALIADDQADVREALGLLLKTEGFRATAVASPAAALEAVESQPFDVVLMDMNYARDTTSGREGLELLGRIHALDSTLPVIVMTAWGTVGLAVETMRRGVGDFVEKPWENETLGSILRAQVARGRALRRARRLQVEAERLSREMEAARQTQSGLLPRRMPRTGGCEIAVSWRPASILGGDYVDVWPLDESRIALGIGDVVGKGAPAALLMSNLQAAVRAVATVSCAPGAVCSRVNRIVCDNMPLERFITFFYARFDASVGALHYANAGHNAPVLIRLDGSVRRLPPTGPVLGVSPDWSCETAWVALGPGDRLVLFTDGVTEARDGRDEELGEERLVSLLRRHRGERPAALRRRVLQTLRRFRAGDPQDDATLLVLAPGPVAARPRRAEGPR